MHDPLGASSIAQNRVGLASLPTRMASAPRFSSFASNSGGPAPASRAKMFQYSSGDKLPDFALAIADELQGHRLHATGAQAARTLSQSNGLIL